MRFLILTVLGLTITLSPLKPLLAQNALEHPRASNLLTLEKAVLLAIANDPWQQKSVFQENAAVARSVSLSSMPDPVVSIGLANMPTDGFAFNQEPMTQLKAGITQMFGRGDTLKFQRQQQLEISQQHPFLRQDRQASVAVTAAQLWLDAYRAKASIQLIENDRALFEQLGEIAQSNYSSALGNTRQQDLLRAELELVRIEDRLLMLSTQHQQAMEKLSEWTAYEPKINQPKLTSDSSNKASDIEHGPHAHRLSAQYDKYELPNALQAVEPSMLIDILAQVNQLQVDSDILSLEQMRALITGSNQHHLAEYLAMHPMIQSIEQKISAGQTGIQIAKQKYKPQWGLNASYAYRDDDTQGISRADFLSIGLSFDLPLFTANRQDQELASAVNEAEAIKTDKRLAMRNMMSALRVVFVNYQRLVERRNLYSTRFLVQTQQQSDATLLAYTNDEGDFAEVVRSRIALLNAQLDALNIEIDLRKATMQMAYYFVKAHPVDTLSMPIQHSNEDSIVQTAVGAK